MENKLIFSKKIKIDLIVFTLIYILMFVLVFLAAANSEGSDLKGFAKLLNEKFSFLIFPIYIIKYIHSNNTIFDFLLMILIPSIFWFIIYKLFQKLWNLLDKI